MLNPVQQFQHDLYPLEQHLLSPVYKRKKQGNEIIKNKSQKLFATLRNYNKQINSTDTQLQ